MVSARICKLRAFNKIFNCSNALNSSTTWTRFHLCRVFQLGEVEYLFLDEADQMLAVGFDEDVEVILEKLPSDRQSMQFSATMPGWVKKLARRYLNDSLTIDLVGDQDEKLAEGIKLFAIPTTATSKHTILSDLVTVYAKDGKAIVFTQTKRDAEAVSMAD